MPLSPYNQAKENHQRSNYISELLSCFSVPPQKVSPVPGYIETPIFSPDSVSARVICSGTGGPLELKQTSKEGLYRLAR